MTARVVVVGLGRMGCRHAAVVRRTPGWKLVAAVDPAGDVSGAAGPGVPVLPDVAALAGYQVDYAVLATPTGSHLALGRQLAAAGIPTLIEKPVAGDLLSATLIRHAYTTAGVPAAVGYIERQHGPALVAHQLLSSGALGDIVEISTVRAGRLPGRLPDTGVVHDLATHDVDLVAWLAGQPYTAIAGRTAHHHGHLDEDLFAAVGQLADGTVTQHRVNWLSPVPVRQVTVTTSAGCLIADTLRGTLLLQHGAGELPPGLLRYTVAHADVADGNEPAGSGAGVRAGASGQVVAGEVTRFMVPVGDALAREHKQFWALAQGWPNRCAGLAAGVQAVAVAQAAVRSARTGDTIAIGAPSLYVPPAAVPRQLAA